jgi:RNA polymerase sigma factor (sigma-70 family)
MTMQQQTKGWILTGAGAIVAAGAACYILSFTDSVVSAIIPAFLGLAGYLVCTVSGFALYAAARGARLAVVAAPTEPSNQGDDDPRSQALVAAIKRLPLRLRKAFVMAHVQCKPRKEIATELRISERRVDRRMTKALKVCRDRLSSQGIHL